MDSHAWSWQIEECADISRLTVRVIVGPMWCARPAEGDTDGSRRELQIPDIRTDVVKCAFHLLQGCACILQLDRGVKAEMPARSKKAHRAPLEPPSQVCDPSITAIKVFSGEICTFLRKPASIDTVTSVCLYNGSFMDKVLDPTSERLVWIYIN